MVRFFLLNSSHKQDYICYALSIFLLYVEITKSTFKCTDFTYMLTSHSICLIIVPGLVQSTLHVHV